MMNIDPSRSTDLNMELKGGEHNRVSGRILTAEKINSMSTFEDTGQFKPVPYDGASIRKNIIKAEIPPKSIIVLRIS